MTSEYRHRTEYIRRLLRESGVDMSRPLPAGTALQCFEGRATGHGALPGNMPCPGPVVDLSGMVPGRIEYHDVSWLRHAITDGVTTRRLYWDGCAGGWADIAHA